MIHTCKKEKNETDQNTVFGTFGNVYSRTAEEGHVTDEYFTSLGYPKDLDANGNIVERLSHADHLQRAKVLNHDHQKAIRKAKLDDAAAKAQQKIADQPLALLLVKEKNEECEKALLRNPNPGGVGVLFGNGSLGEMKC